MGNKIKIAQRVCNWTSLALVIFGVFWTRSRIPVLEAAFHAKDDTLTRVSVPEWYPLCVIMASLLLWPSWVLRSWYALRLWYARLRHEESLEMIERIKTVPQSFAPEERVQVLDDYFATKLAKERSEAQAWMNDVHDSVLPLVAVLLTLPFWPLLYLFYGALFGWWK